MQRALLGGAGPFKRLWSAYENQLQRHPVPTQMTTSFLLWGAGDVLAQRIERMEAQQEAHAAQTAACAAAEAAAADARMHTDASASQSSEVGLVAGAGGAVTGAAAGGGDACLVDAPLDSYRMLMTALFGAVLVGPIGHYW